ncbi:MULTISPECIES: helix-turn-helix domain-containing protein [unclassified Janthinobacterium]|jgi:transcriptional regulator with XRE-family HTH domain|uniref:helix-turn-helix domain-containing protein n=1 Tax=unclassified Janthinobacterium TaxID=2610881 RepID=UPI000B82C1A8|nr:MULTISPECIES: helix-turn-helix domain-containing protein [unclassified Janthinobacterium]MCX7293592.1 helix-turn-helix domain-containing protein [Janthinobacterium sp.]
MRSIGEILKEERQRLGMNQEDFAAVGGLKRRAQTLYEQDERAPDALYLRALAGIGVDVHYILTGERLQSAVTSDERELLDGYRSMDVRGKAGVLGMIGGMRSPTPPASQAGNAPHVETHGKIGQNFVGNIIGPQTFNVAGSGRKKEK